MSSACCAPSSAPSNELTLALSGTGTAGMEAAVVNFVEPGTKVAVLVNGYFCERIAEMARRQGAEVVRLEKPWGEAFDDDEAPGLHPPGAAPGRGLRPRRDLHRRAAARRGHLRRGPRGRRPGDRRLRHLAGQRAGRRRRHRHRHRLQLQPEGPGLRARAGPITVSPAGPGRPGGRRPARAVLLPRPAPPARLLGRRPSTTTPPRPPSSTPCARRWRSSPRRVSRVASGGSRPTTAPSSPGSRPWGCEMHVAAGHRLCAAQHGAGARQGCPTPRCAGTCSTARGIEILGGFGPLAGRVFRIGIMGAGSTRENVLLLLEGLQAALAEQGFRVLGRRCRGRRAGLRAPLKPAELGSGWPRVPADSPVASRGVGGPAAVSG